MASLPGRAGQRAARRRRAPARQARWFPLVAFGIVVLGATPFYWQAATKCTGGRTSCPSQTPPSPLGGLLLPFERDGHLTTWATVYWMCTLAAGLILTAFFSQRRAKQSGTILSTWPAIAVSLVFVALLMLTSPQVLRALGANGRSIALLLPDLRVRGLTPLLVVAVVLLALALVERSRSLTLFATAFGALAVTANLYDLENVLARLGWRLGPGAGPLPNILVPGLVLLAGAGVFFALDRKQVAVQGR